MGSGTGGPVNIYIRCVTYDKLKQMLSSYHSSQCIVRSALTYATKQLAGFPISQSEHSTSLPN